MKHRLIVMLLTIFIGDADALVESAGGDNSTSGSSKSKDTVIKVNTEEREEMMEHFQCEEESKITEKSLPEIREQNIEKADNELKELEENEADEDHILNSTIINGKYLYF